MSNNNQEPSLEEKIRVQQAFLRAKAEYAAQEEERKKRIYEQAEKAAEERRKENARRAAEREYRRNHPWTEEEREEGSRKFKEALEMVKQGKKIPDDF